VLEPETVSVSLSHYCPTAAGLLFRQDTGLSLVEGPPGFPAAWPFEGLDARSTYPPFLRPGVLLGFDGLRTFEQEAVGVLAGVELWRSLGRIEGAVAAFRGWVPARGPLTDHIRASFRAAAATSTPWRSADPSPTLTASLTKGAQVDLRLPAFSESTLEPPPGIDVALRRYLAARLIAAWIMFQAEDIDAVMRYLRLCLNTVLLFEADQSRETPEPSRWKEAIRSADLWILHYCDPELLARNLG
jgi:hypothetical protein